jgi:hypothetical protein
VERTVVIGRRNGLSSALLFAAAFFVIVSCTTPRGEAADCGGRSTLTEAAFRYQFVNNQSSLQDRASAYFISVEGDADPSAELLARFADHQPPVKPLSAARRANEQIQDPATGQRALIFRVSEIQFETADDSRIKAGYEEGRLSASWITLSASCIDSRWSLIPVGPQIIS